MKIEYPELEMASRRLYIIMNGQCWDSADNTIKYKYYNIMNPVIKKYKKWSETDTSLEELVELCAAELFYSMMKDDWARTGDHIKDKYRKDIQIIIEELKNNKKKAKTIDPALEYVAQWLYDNKIGRVWDAELNGVRNKFYSYAEKFLSGLRILKATPIDRYVEALTPSEDTRKTYSGRFKTRTGFCVHGSHGINAPEIIVDVPWPVVIEIMQAIRERAENEQ